MQSSRLFNDTRTRRIAKSLTQEELAGLVGVSRQTIWQIETGQTEPSIRLALRIAEALDVSVHDLFSLVPRNVEIGEVNLL